MEFTKTSNLGSLIAAVLVGLLSLCINQVFRLTPGDLDRLLSRTNKQTAIRRSPEKLLQDIQHEAALLEEMFRARLRVQLADRAKRTDVEELKRSVARIEQANADLENAGSPQQRRAGLTSSFKAVFFAAELAPRQFSDLLRELGDRILAAPSAPENQRVRLLLQFHECGVLRSDDATVLANLRAFSAKQADVSFAIAFYALVADELVRRRPDLCRAVLELGLRLYDQHPEKRKLVERLIDLKIKATRSGRSGS